MAPETLFDKEILNDYDSKGVHEQLYKSIWDCDIYLRRELVGNIILCGGNSLISGLSERLKAEVDKQCP